MVTHIPVSYACRSNQNIHYDENQGYLTSPIFNNKENLQIIGVFIPREISVCFKEGTYIC